jgi:hypothetical protein
MQEADHYFELASSKPLDAVNAAFKDYALDSTQLINKQSFSAASSDFFSSSYAVLTALWRFAFSEEVRADLNNANNDDEINQAIHKFLSHLRTKLRKKEIEVRIGDADQGLQRYHARDAVVIISADDKEKIQKLIDELRMTLSSTEIFDESHRRRLLRRLERMQAELHKSVSDLDVFYGGFTQAGIVLGKFGKDAKPFFDRMKELTEIVWKTQKSADEISEETDFPKLPGAE